MNVHRALLKDITNDSIIKTFQERQPRRKRFDLPSVSGSFCLFSPSLSISFIFQFNVVPRRGNVVYIEEQEEFHGLKKNTQSFQNREEIWMGGGICWLARIYVYPTSDSIPKHLWICMIFGGIRKIFNPVFFHSLLDQEFDRKGFCMLFVMLLPSPLKELYTSETTLTPRALWITSLN